MGNCFNKEIKEIIEIEEIELDNLEPLPIFKKIKPYIYKNKLKNQRDYNFKNNLYWIYRNEYHFKNNI